MCSTRINNYDIVIFDCDGVLIDSNLLKCEAFGKSIKEEYEDNIVVSFVNHCKNSFGVSRYEKFREFFSNFANEPFDESKYRLFLNRYAHLCKELYFEANLTPSVERLLSQLSSLGTKLFVASGSDEKELIEVFKERSLNNYFLNIYGSPRKKNECVSEILKNYPGQKAVFIGDTFSDLKASKEHNLDFIYMSKFTVQSRELDEICRKEAKIVIDTLEDLI